MANRANVGQHIIPECYLKHFGAADGTVFAQDKGTGRIFPGGPAGLCQENEIYTLLVGGKRDYSFESINNDIESALGPVLTELRAGIDLNQEGMRTRIFTHLTAFTANLTARSLVLRNHFNGSLARINTFLTDHPDLWENFPEVEFQNFLDHPEKYTKVLQRFPGGTKYLELLRAQRASIPAEVSDMIECLNSLVKVHYPVLLKARTGATVDLLVEIEAKADLLLTDHSHFISGDDPVVFMTDGARETMVVPTKVQQWMEPGRGIYLPLNPKTAILWSPSGSYSAGTISASEVRRYNALVKENAVRHVLACDPADFAA
jgi:hypothetical protein